MLATTQGTHPIFCQTNLYELKSALGMTEYISNSFCISRACVCICLTCRTIWIIIYSLYLFYFYIILILLKYLLLAWNIDFYHKPLKNWPKRGTTCLPKYTHTLDEDGIFGNHQKKIVNIIKYIHYCLSLYNGSMLF